MLILFCTRSGKHTPAAKGVPPDWHYVNARANLDSEGSVIDDSPSQCQSCQSDTREGYHPTGHATPFYCLDCTVFYGGHQPECEARPQVIPITDLF